MAADGQRLDPAKRPTDLDLSQRLDLFRSLLAAHESQMLGLAYAITGDWHAAQDLTQEALVKLHDGLVTNRIRQGAVSWLRAAIHNASLNHVRQCTRHPTCPLGDGHDGPSEGVTPERLWVLKELEAEIERLGPRDAAIVELRVFERRSYADIAACLGCTAHAAEKAFQRATRKLARRMRPP